MGSILYPVWLIYSGAKPSFSLSLCIFPTNSSYSLTDHIRQARPDQHHRALLEHRHQEPQLRPDGRSILQNQNLEGKQAESEFCLQSAELFPVNIQSIQFWILDCSDLDLKTAHWTFESLGSDEIQNYSCSDRYWHAMVLSVIRVYRIWLDGPAQGA